MNNKLILGSLWAATVGVAFYFGFLSRESITPEYEGSLFEQIIKDAQEREKEREKKNASVDDLSLTASSEYGGFESFQLDFQNLEQETKDQKPLSGQRIREILGPALVSSDLVGRNAVIAQMLSRLTPENAKHALDVFENTPSSYHTDNNYRLFLHAWAKVDGASALAYIMDNKNAHRVEGGEVWAMSGWTAADPQAAYNFVTSRDKIDHGLYHGLVRGWGRIDLEGAQEFVSNIEDKRLRGRLTDVVGESFVEQHGIQGALEWASQLDGKSGFSQVAFDSVAKRAIPQSSGFMAEWISRNPDNKFLKPWMFEYTAGKLAGRDPGLAASWLETHLENNNVNGRVIGQVVSKWVERDPSSAANWVDSLKGTKVYDKELAKKLAGTWARKDSAAAFEWARKLDSNLWVPASASIVGNLPKEELANNAAWIKESPAENRNDGVRAAYAMRMADEDPYEAIEQALLMKDTLGREKITVHIAKKLYKKDPRGIKQWLPQSGLSKASQQRILRND